MKPCRLVLLDGRVRLQPSQGFKALWPPLDDFELQVGDDHFSPQNLIWNHTLHQSNRTSRLIKVLGVGPKCYVVILPR